MTAIKTSNDSEARPRKQTNTDTDLMLCSGPSRHSKVLSELRDDGDSERSLSSTDSSNLPSVSSSELSSDTEPRMKCEAAKGFSAGASCSAMAGRHWQAPNTDGEKKEGWINEIFMGDEEKQNTQVILGKEKKKEWLQPSYFYSLL